MPLYTTVNTNCITQTAVTSSATNIWCTQAVTNSTMPFGGWTFGSVLSPVLNPVQNQIAIFQQVPMSAEEAQQNAERQQQAVAAAQRAAQIMEAQRAQSTAASERARGLLLSFLNKKEREEFEGGRTISVRGASGANYRITWGRTANIEVIDKKKVTHRLCIHPEDRSIPIEDVMLAQLLHLRANENEVLRVANRHGPA